MFTDRIPNIEMAVHSIERNSGVKIHFRNKLNEDIFMKKFRDTNFGSDVSMSVFDQTRSESQTTRTITTLTCVIRGIPTNLEIDELKKHLLKSNIPITNVTRIKNDRRPLPLVRLFVKDSKLVSYLLTNGLTRGHTRFKIEESRTAARPFPCRTFIQCHEGQKCTNKPNCYKCDESYFSYNCKITPNKNDCATCRKLGHRTAAGECPLQPRQGKR